MAQTSVAVDVAIIRGHFDKSVFVKRPQISRERINQHVGQVLGWLGGRLKTHTRIPGDIKCRIPALYDMPHRQYKIVLLVVQDICFLDLNRAAIV